MSDREQNLKQLQSLSRLLDSQWNGPLGIKFGLDGILGFFPVVGDLVTSTLSFLIIFRAAQLGCGFNVLTRMIFNVAIDNLMDTLPILGNFFDIGWKANLKNVKLLELHMTDRPPGTPWLLLISLCLVFAGMVYLFFILGSWLWHRVDQIL